MKNLLPPSSSSAPAGFDATRRRVLQTGGALFVGLAAGGSLAATAAAPAAEAAGAAPAKTVALDQVGGFLSIDAGGKVTVYSGKVDLGTGVRTAMAQIAAEELSVPLSSVEVVQGDTLLTPDQGPTYGSLSIQIGGMQIRQAAATARAALVGMAAQQLGVGDRDKLAVQDGVIRSAGDGASLSYAQLVGGRDFSLKIDPKAPLKDPQDYTVVGQSVPRLDIPAKVTGGFTYMQDFKVPGMVHARIVRPAGMKSELQSVDDAACKRLPGYLGMVKKGNSFLAVLARNEWDAIRASRTIQAKWSDWAGLPEQSKLWESVRNAKVAKSESMQKIGDAAAAFKNPGGKVLEATYDFAIHTHGSMGPSAAVAEHEGRRAHRLDARRSRRTCCASRSSACCR